MIDARQSGSPSRANFRCAIYTRKSSEEGLEQEFNSLDAQREACEAYIVSQKHEGWTALAARYDDGAYSGGTMERPALQRLLEDIRARKIEIVVVYKVDRLTRSLADFAKIVEIFDAQGVSFVSVTQAFNTTSSMGRLTLNVLLSFAQFEREVTGERIRDKIAASKKKGMWMGGQPALGYDVKERKLVVNEPEAATVRAIFRRYLELGSVRALRDDLAARGVVSKRRVAADGSPYGGQRFSRGALYLMLKNPLYRGQTVHKDKTFLGEHAAIVDEELWAKVQSLLEEHRVERRDGGTPVEPSVLTGLLFDADAEPMTPTHAVKKGTRYRYYVSRRLITGRAAESLRGQRLPAANLETLIIDRLRALLADPVEVLNAISKNNRDAPTQKRLRDGAAALSARWEHLPTEALHGLTRAILVRAQIHSDRIDLDVDPGRLVRWLLDEGGKEAIDARLPNERSSANADDADRLDRLDEPLIRLSIPASLKRAGNEMKFVIDGVSNSTPADATLIRLLLRGSKIRKRMFAPGEPPFEDIAAEEGISSTYATRLVRLTFTSTDIVAAILAGKQPAGLTANKLMADTRLPLDWSEQRTALGFT